MYSFPHRYGGKCILIKPLLIEKGNTERNFLNLVLAMSFCR